MGGRPLAGAFAALAAVSANAQTDTAAYDARLRASAAAAESFQGPLDGGWTLRAEGGGDLYALQLTDTRDCVEGAWRDLRSGARGYVEAVDRKAGGVVIRFESVEITLQPDLRGLLLAGGRTARVRLLRSAPSPAL